MLAVPSISIPLGWRELSFASQDFTSRFFFALFAHVTLLHAISLTVTFRYKVPTRNSLDKSQEILLLVFGEFLKESLIVFRMIVIKSGKVFPR